MRDRVLGLAQVDREGHPGPADGERPRVTMVVVTVLVVVDIVLRRFAYADDGHTGAVVLAVTLVVALLTVIGGSIGGSLAYDYGFNVETSGDHPVWHRSEVDVFPGDKHP